MVSVVFEHVRRPITVAEVHGGSMRLALRLSVTSSRHQDSEASRYLQHEVYSICLQADVRTLRRLLHPGITSDVGVEHRNARRCAMLVAHAPRGTLDPEAMPGLAGGLQDRG